MGYYIPRTAQERRRDEERRQIGIDLEAFSERLHAYAQTPEGQKAIEEWNDTAFYCTLPPVEQWEWRFSPEGSTGNE